MKYVVKVYIGLLEELLGYSIYGTWAKCLPHSSEESLPSWPRDVSGRVSSSRETGGLGESPRKLLIREEYVRCKYLNPLQLDVEKPLL